MTPLQQATQDILERWDAPVSEAHPDTAEYSYGVLRRALDAELAMTVEPVACIYNGNQYMRHEFMNDKIPEGSTPLYLHPPQQADKGPWCAGVTKEDARVHIQSDDFKHDVRLYVNGDFATKDENYLYACALARHLNSAAAMLEADVSLINEGNKAQQSKQVPMTTEQIQQNWDVASGSTPGWCRHITYARAIEAHHGIGGEA